MRDVVIQRLNAAWPKFVKSFLKGVRRDLGKSTLTQEDVEQIMQIVGSYDPNEARKVRESSEQEP
jgi:hypothetical protein